MGNFDSSKMFLKVLLVFVFSDFQSRVFREIFVFLKIQQKPEKPHFCNYFNFSGLEPEKPFPEKLSTRGKVPAFDS